MYRGALYGDPSNLDIAATFLELGNTTSQNLAFSHSAGVSVSYGEETITETNLLEIRRRHPRLIRLRTFPKHVEAKTGADWEWHVVGRKRTLKMRVQAKRLQCNGVLKIVHKVKSSGRQQRDLLIDKARTAGMRAVYCIYCTEPQRWIWKKPKAPPGYRGFQTGCLLADATDVPLRVRTLGAIEGKCRPWHHLFLPATMMQKDSLAVDSAGFRQLVRIRQLRVSTVTVPQTKELSDASRWNLPTIKDLNEGSGCEFDRGIEETTDEDLARLESDTKAAGATAHADERRLRELGITRMMVMDVRGDPDSDARYE